MSEAEKERIAQWIEIDEIDAFNSLKQFSLLMNSGKSAEQANE